MLKTLLVTLVVSISAITPFATAQVDVNRDPIPIVVTEMQPPSDVVVLKLLAEGEQPAVAPDLKDVPLPQPKPEVVAPIPSTAIAIGPALDMLVGFAGVLATMVSGFWAWIKMRLFKSEMDGKHKQAIHDAAKNGVLWAAEKVKARLGENPHIDVKSEMLATIGNYLIATVPDALKWFKFDMTDKSEYEDIAVANAAKLGIDINTAKAVA